MIDWQRVSELYGDVGKGDFIRVLDLFMTEMEAIVADLPATGTALPAALETLAGCARDLGLRQLADHCMQAVRALEAQPPAPVDLPRIADCYTQSRAALESDLAQLRA